MDDIDERLRADIAASLLQAIHFAMSINADPAELASSRIVRTIAELEAERDDILLGLLELRTSRLSGQRSAVANPHSYLRSTSHEG